MRLVTSPGRVNRRNEFAKFLPSDDLKYTKLKGRYLLDGIIGKGGMGTVYLAKDLSDDSTVVVKIREKNIRKKVTKKRITSEIDTLKAVKHKNLVTLKDSGVVDGKAFVVMELMQGNDLSKYLDRMGTAPWASARYIISEACQGLGAMHENGIIHKDVKPENIFLTEEGTVKVFDFDLSIFTNLGDEHNPGILCGTPALLPPEVARWNSSDLRGDIYSLGVVMYAALSGRYPFTGERHIQLLFAIMKNDAQPLSQLVPDLPRGVDEVVGKAMAKDPDKRFQSMEEMRDAILNISRGLSVLSYKGPGLEFGGAHQKIPTLPLLRTLTLITQKISESEMLALAEC